MTNKTRVIVYGTLKKGHSNHRLLDKSEFLGWHKLGEAYALIDLGPFPGVVKVDTGPTKGVWGQVYSITEDTLHALDVLEGNNTFYTRHKVSTGYKNAWLYCLPNSYTENYEIMDVAVWRPNKEEVAHIAEASK